MTSNVHPASYNFCSETLKSNLCKGFSLLQQQQEFVDITIATDGHFVKAHQNILALASPYLKGLLQSAPCQHPVIFLCNVGHDILAYILEFVYTGEVQVPSNKYSSFINAAQQMHIKGLENLNTVINVRTVEDEENVPEVQNDFVNLDDLSDINMKLKPNTAASLDISENARNNKRLTENLHIQESNEIANNTECDINKAEYENTVIDIANTFHQTQPNEVATDTFVNHLEVYDVYEVINSTTKGDLSDTQNEKTVRDIANTFHQNLQSVAAASTSENQVIVYDLINGTTKVDASNTQNERPVIEISDTFHVHQLSEAETATSKNQVVVYDLTNSTTKGNLSNTQNERTVTDIVDSFHQYQPSEAAAESSVNFVALDRGGSSTKNFIKQVDLSQNDASSQLAFSNPHTVELQDQSISQDTTATPLYTISKRGSLLMILNRFLYNMHHCSDNGHKRRWRCIEYRLKKCLAYVDTLDEKIISRVHAHTHGFHDEKIISIGSKKNIFTSIKQATK